jgi:hypothetical protein
MGDGDSGNNFLQSVMGVGSPGTDVTSFSAGADKLLAAAKGGGFAVNDEGGQAYLNALEEFRQELEAASNDLSLLKRAPQLGNGPYADHVAMFTAEVFDGDDRSLLPVIDKLKQQIDKVNEAFEIAKKNYNQADSEHDQKIRSIDMSRD